MNRDQSIQNKCADVCLISPPFMLSMGPSLALGLLKAALCKEGISCYVDYADMHMIKALGSEIFWRINTGNMMDFLGDYVFTSLAGIEPEYCEDQIIAMCRKNGNPLESLEVGNVISFARKVAEEQTEATVQRILQYNPKIVGVTSCFQQRNASIAILRRLKQLRPDIVTMMGGANCFGQAGLALLREFSVIDYVFFGESDDIFGPVCKSVLAGENKPLPYGVLKRGDELPKVAPHRIISDMDALPYPNFDDYFEMLSTEEGRYVRLLNEKSGDKRDELSLFLETSRGCWWGEKTPCTFCGLHGQIRQFRQKSPKRAFDELCALTEKYSISKVYYTDCIMPTNWIDEFVPLLMAHPKKFKLFHELRSHYSAEQIEKLAQAGYYYLQPGIESLSDHELQLMHKGVSMLQNLNFLKFSRKNDILLSWNIIYGFPGETPEDYWEQIELIPLIEHMPPPNGSSWILYARNNEYANNGDKYGLNLSPANIYKYTSPAKEDYIDDIAIYYDGNTRPAESIQKAAAKLGNAVLKWIECSKKKTAKPRLDMADLGDKLLVIDTRSCRDLRAQYLIGAERDVYRLCSSPIKLSCVCEKLSGQYTEAEIETAIRNLEIKKLLITHKDSIFALAIPYDLDTIKRKDIEQFQSVFYKSPQLREYINSDIEKCGGSAENIKEIVTTYAGKMGMCFDANDYERLAMPYRIIV